MIPKVFGFADLLKESNTQYVVPFFQRGYVWKKPNWDELFNDVMNNIFDWDVESMSEEDVKNKKHFFGAIVLKDDSVDPPRNKYLVIDGQQRLITCYAILLAIHRKLIEVEKKNESGHASSQKFKYDFLVNATDNENNYNELKVRSSQGDTLSFYKYISGDVNPILPDGLLDREIELNTEALKPLFTYCKKKLDADFNDRNKLLNIKSAILYSLQFVCIYLPDDFDEQVIFETLNAKGVELTPSELLGNYIFGEINRSNTYPDDATLENLHYDKWLKLQRKLAKARRDMSNSEEYSDFEAFLRCSISVGRDKMLPKGRIIYYRFKEWCQGDKVLPEINKIQKDLDYFISYINPSTKPEFESSMSKFLDVGIHSVIPFVIAVLREHNNGKINTELAIKLFNITLTLIVRLKVSGTNPKYDTFFPNLWDKIGKSPDNSDKVLIEIINNNRWIIDDTKFIEYLKMNVIYRIKDQKFCRYLLKNIDQKVSNYGQEIDYSKFSEIEHILPQTPDTEPKWVEHLGQELEDPELQNIIHSIGNLTLLGHGNSAVQNKFIEDKLKHKAYADPMPPITKIAADIYNKNQEWRMASIRTRSAELAKHACEIWAWEK